MLKVIILAFILSQSHLYSFTLDSLDFNLIQTKGKVLEKTFELYNDSLSKKEYSFLLKPIKSQELKKILEVTPKNIVLEANSKANFKIKILKNTLKAEKYEYYLIIKEKNLEYTNKAVLNKNINIRQKFTVVE